MQSGVCSFYVERNLNMTFVYCCPQSDIMLRHYDKGPCRDKLGHSRASLFLHRTQVNIYLLMVRLSCCWQIHFYPVIQGPISYNVVVYGIFAVNCCSKFSLFQYFILFFVLKVVAGFAFFGLMVLVASPFLLLVSPCLLLSKCLFRK